MLITIYSLSLQATFQVQPNFVLAHRQYKLDVAAANAGQVRANRQQEPSAHQRLQELEI